MRQVEGEGRPMMMKGGPLWNRLAAATGLGFVLVAVAVYVLQEWNEFSNVGQFALLGSNEVWGSFVILVGFASVLLFWFVSTAAERLRQIEQAAGGSGRLARTFFASGAAISAILVLQVGVQFTARQATEIGMAALAASLLEGPTLAFPIVAFLFSAGLIAVRAGDMLPMVSQRVGQLAVVASAAYLALAGFQIFKNYAWIDETGYFTFLAFVGLLSVIGIQRWGELDTGFTPETGAPPQPARVSAPAETTAETVARKAPARRKPAAKRKPAKRKPAARKSSTRKR